MRKIFAFILILFFAFQSSAFAKKREAIVIPDNSGYVGTLPTLDGPFMQSKVIDANPSFDYQDGFNDPDAIKNVPRNNPSFVNIIIKSDKSSKYLNDINDLIPIVESLQDVIESNGNVQLFNAKSYFLRKNVEYFRDKYKNQAEESYISYRKVLELNNHVQSVARLRLESEAYSPYVPESGTGNMFTQNSIDTQLSYLLSDIKKTLVVLRDTK